ncbi:hypothetical protein TSUD_15140 [Trifolium subterraneum]|uniref:Uncharacterized protein n=1 Tax=Trifolium subterraneum TaxID=3900 RepID=A0A2Z6NSQ6_TRISU|nr:hypothetical protein TSUD_15140 [Trifolium subterraneum]
MWLLLRLLFSQTWWRNGGSFTFITGGRNRQTNILNLAFDNHAFGDPVSDNPAPRNPASCDSAFGNFASNNLAFGGPVSGTPGSSNPASCDATFGNLASNNPLVENGPMMCRQWQGNQGLLVQIKGTVIALGFFRNRKLR